MSSPDEFYRLDKYADEDAMTKPEPPRERPCPDCEGIHFGSLWCPYKRCSECGELTELACSDCAINGLGSIKVCSRSECRDKHESRMKCNPVAHAPTPEPIEKPAKWCCEGDSEKHEHSPECRYYSGDCFTNGVPNG